MIDVYACITQRHDLWLVVVALVVCLIGSAGTVQLFGRIRAAWGGSRIGWLVLCAVGTGTMVWCTHFVAMMAFHTGVPVALDPLLTLASLAIAIVVGAPGLAMAASRRRWLVLPGGAIVGAAISAMHYTGMVAYRIDGVIEWRTGYVVASVVLSSLIAAAAFGALRSRLRWRGMSGGGLLGFAVAVLHFTGMTAMRIRALDLPGIDGLSGPAMTALALSTACAALLFVGCAAVSALIDGQTQSESYRRMRRMAMHDGLTDLPNRLAFQDELGLRLARRGGARELAVVMLDLSRFKSVNDTYGHQAGDQLLVALAARMTDASSGERACIARLGGDEFAALISYDDPAALSGALDRLASVFAAPFVFERFSATIGANIGVALAPRDGRDADTLLARADLAMYRAKGDQSGTPHFYDPTMDEAVRERRELANQLREAVAAGTFELHYQVQASPVTGDISGYEALVRWRHPTRGLVPPSNFIPLAEEIGEIVPLSEWILRQACFEAALWTGRYPVAVNLSAHHLSDPKLVKTVKAALDRSGLPPDRLVLELTESAIIRDRDVALRQLGELKAMGIRLALDDFGVGYSSLDVLRSFEFDKIKLDASFVAEIETSPQAVAILRSVSALGASLGIPVLAEGIEDVAQMQIVATEGCAEIQGYLIGRPARSLANPAEVRSAVTVRKPSGSPVSLVA